MKAVTKVLLLITSILVIAVIAVLVKPSILKRMEKEKPNDVAIDFADSNISGIVVNKAPEIVIPERGTIQGSVVYPDQEVPKGLSVCAENQASHDVICTNDSEFGSGMTYHLLVPVKNSYYIYVTDS